jgi:hypothetical protein
MLSTAHEPAIHDYFKSKNLQLSFIPDRTECLTLQALESFRVARRVVPASKHGLEVLCGGSCETGAQ